MFFILFYLNRIYLNRKREYNFFFEEIYSYYILEYIYYSNSNILIQKMILDYSLSINEFRNKIYIVKKQDIKVEKQDIKVEKI